MDSHRASFPFEPRLSALDTSVAWQLVEVSGAQMASETLRKQSLVERYGPDIRLPDLREEIAQFERCGQTHGACMVRYVDLIPR